MTRDWEEKLDAMILRGKFDIGEVKDLFRSVEKVARQETLHDLLKRMPKGFDAEGTLLDIYREQYEDGFNACLNEIKEIISNEMKK